MNNINIEDSKFVRQNFRLLLQLATVLVALGNLFYACVFWVAGIDTWSLNLLWCFLCIPVLWLLNENRPFSISFLGILLLFFLALTWPAYLTLTFGRDAGFHFPLITILPIIAVSGRIGRVSKWFLIITMALLIIKLDQTNFVLDDNELGAELTHFFHLLNGMIAVFALTGLVFHYFQLVTKQQASLREQAITDSMTGLFNRLYMQETASQAIVQCQRYENPYSILLCDLDDFKAVNDKLGHQAGDEVLRRVSSIFKQHARESDSVGRWGGEEFLILLPQTEKEGAFQLANRIRESIEDTELTIHDQLHKVTVSIGVSCMRSMDNLDSMIARADTALYEAKDGGRNKVEVESPLGLEALC